ncbi:hypothetical protein CYMTET_52132 [Cymbomonas tetramitiformis]|uniref:Nucleotide-diphospho-sugar transferase domain-containing protein n=1 Tax=Cymbomonas tetramitiformis TaxID=36881 RepID=A0AAE0ERE0_9CHLO|nr:hypothetical protein CYMTET_52132 [Cymbomonas tetramitiformis]
MSLPEDLFLRVCVLCFALFTLHSPRIQAQLEDPTIEDCLPSISLCPTEASLRLPTEEVEGSLTSALKKASSRSVDNTVVLSLTHSALSEGVQRANNTLLQIWVVVAVDEDGFQQCQEFADGRFPGLTCARDPFFLVDPISEEAVNGRHRNWLPFRWRSVELMVASVQSGYNVIFTNPGVSWLRDPRPDFQQLADVDLALLPLYRNAEYQKWLAGNDIGSPGPVSGDMFFMRSSPQGRAFGRQWIAAGAQEIHKIGHRSFHEGLGLS